VVSVLSKSEEVHYGKDGLDSEINITLTVTYEISDDWCNIVRLEKIVSRTDRLGLIFDLTLNISTISGGLKTGD
jgi:hypothetical protein